jgi:hypothetical protein
VDWINLAVNHSVHNRVLETAELLLAPELRVLNTEIYLTNATNCRKYLY